MKANDFVVLALRSPFHVLRGETMLLTVTGRKTGRKITLPVNYDRDGDDLWILSSRDRTWWRNLLHGGAVEVRLRNVSVASLPGVKAGSVKPCSIQVGYVYRWLRWL